MFFCLLLNFYQHTTAPTPISTGSGWHRKLLKLLNTPSLHPSQDEQGHRREQAGRSPRSAGGTRTLEPAPGGWGPERPLSTFSLHIPATLPPRPSGLFFQPPPGPPLQDKGERRSLKSSSACSLLEQTQTSACPALGKEDQGGELRFSADPRNVPAPGCRLTTHNRAMRCNDPTFHMRKEPLRGEEAGQGATFSRVRSGCHVGIGLLARPSQLLFQPRCHLPQEAFLDLPPIPASLYLQWTVNGDLSASPTRQRVPCRWGWGRSPGPERVTAHLYGTRGQELKGWGCFPHFSMLCSPRRSQWKNRIKIKTPTMCCTPRRGWTNDFGKGPESELFGLCRPYGVCHSYSTPPF